MGNIGIAIRGQNVPQNIYTNALRMSFEWHNSVCGKIMQSNDWDRMFPTKRAKKIKRDEFDFSNARSTAVILLGFSSCGKTTYAHEFASKYGYEIVSYDIAIANVMKSYIDNRTPTTYEMMDHLGSYEFGNILEKAKRAKKNVVIDGLYVTPNARGALLKTLRQIGYKNIVCISFINIPDDIVEQRIKSRSIALAMQEEADEINEFVSMAMHVVSGRHVNSDKPVEYWLQTEAYRNYYEELRKDYDEEPYRCSYFAQVEYGILERGFDYFIDLY